MHHRLEPGRYRDIIVQETRALADAGRRDLGSRVPSCPDWDVAALLQHLWRVQDFWRLIVSGQVTDPATVQRSEAPPQDLIADALVAGADALVATLAVTDPALEVYTWTDEKTVAWLTRRQAQEAAVHRWDGQNAVGQATPIATELAVDGVDEWFECMVEPTSGRGVIRLEATDSDAAWHTDTGAARLSPSPPDVTVRGTGSDLLLALWRRMPIADLVVDGDAGLATQLLGTADLT